MATARTQEWAALALVLGFASLIACGTADDVASQQLDEPVALQDQEDAVCGMVVSEQSAPRSQVVHGDGSRFFFCSLGDMLVYLDAPSPHGAPQSTFVEVMSPGEDPGQGHFGEHPWVRLEDAVYVVGVHRRGIMGEPVLAYARKDEAESVAVAHSGAQVLNSLELRAWWRDLATAR